VFEEKLGKKARLNMLPMQPGDVTNTEADVSATRRDLDYSPKVSIEEGVSRFVDWYLDYYGG
jgi:UDP-glucuronate 4-epimerase